jgi:hypothetical protein
MGLPSSRQHLAWTRDAADLMERRSTGCDPWVAGEKVLCAINGAVAQSDDTAAGCTGPAKTRPSPRESSDAESLIGCRIMPRS